MIHNANRPGHFYSGISGLQLPIPKREFPEPYRDASRLTYYSTFFNSIEINSSFYRLPMARTVEKWASSVPGDFRFTFKLWKEITHAKALEFKEPDVELFFNAISSAGHKKGCVLVQFPPSLGDAHRRQLDALLRCIVKANRDKWKIAIEFRNRSWYNEDVYELAALHDAAVVIQDIPKSATPMSGHSSGLVYLRFHGPSGNYRDSYPGSFLSEYASYIKEWLEEGKTVYAYFNNTMGDAFRNLQTLNSFVAQ
jgi:uncharacterized protein YecE (DUF72 family)